MKHRKCIPFFVSLFLLVLAYLWLRPANSHSGSFSQADLLEDYEYMWAALEENFPLFEAAENRYGIDRREIYARYKDALLRTSDMDVTEFYELLSGCLSEFRYTGHLSVADAEVFRLNQEAHTRFSNAELAAYGEEKAEQAYAYLEQKQLEDEKQQDTKGKASSAPENGIYLKYYGEVPAIVIESFACEDMEQAGNVAEKLKSVLKECSQAPDIVIDLRGNSGGNTLVWTNGFLPYLGKDELVMTSYQASINGELNRSMFPIDFFAEPRYRDTTYEIESFRIKEDTDFEALSGMEMEACNASELERCDLFLKVTKRQAFSEEERWAAEGNLWCLIDSSTASAAASFAWTLKSAGLAAVIGPETGGKIGGGLLPPMQAAMMLPNSGLIVRYDPYYILNEDGSCMDFGMHPDITEENPEFWIWKNLG